MITFFQTEDILRYETFEFGLNPEDSSESVLICPWHTLFTRRLLDSVPNNYYKYTICKFHLVGTAIQKKIESMGIEKVFTPHASTHDNCLFQTVPFFHYAGSCVELKKDIHYSFLGWSNVNQVRVKMFENLSNTPNIIGKPHGFWRNGNLTDPVLESEYNELLGRSRFSLCPKGAGPGTIRFWESLKCGSIPILISDSVILPSDWDWSKTILRIPEKSIFTERNVIERYAYSVSPSKEIEMRKNCKEAFAKYYNLDYVKSLFV